MTLREMAKWIASAEPRQTKIYHKGFLAVDAIEVPELKSCRNILLLAEDKGLIDLVQRRLPSGKFEYRMQRREKLWPHSAELLMLESSKRDMLRERAERL